MKHQILRMKLELKNLAKSIKITKSKRGPENNGYIPELGHMRSRYRHMHVVYCLARGRTLEQVDSGKGLDMDCINFQLEALKGEKKLYVVVDKSLSSSQQAVQSAHAVAAFCKKYPATMWSNGTLVLLKDSADNMRYRFYYPMCYEWAEFKEPNLQDRLTAYAVFGPGLEDRFKKYSLV